MTKRLLKKRLSVLLSLFMLILTLIPVNTAEAIFCGSMGENMSVHAINKDSIDFPDMGDRTYTIRELFSDKISFVGIHGEANKPTEGFSSWLVNEPETGNKIRSGVKDDENAIKRIEGEYNAGSCMASGPVASISSLLLGAGSFMSNISDGFVSALFNPEKMTDSLANIIGGSNSATAGESIMGRLGSGLFLPLSVLAMAFTGLWIAYTGFVKKEFRIGLQGAAWSICAFVLGVMIVTIPHVVVKAPQTANTIIADCVSSSVTGGNCLTGKKPSASKAPKWMEGCVSSTTNQTTSAQNISMKINSLNCVLWKTFTLDNYALMQFGYNYDNLETSKVKSLVGKPQDYCIPLYSADSPKQLNKDSIFKGKDTSVCNLAIYAPALRTEAHFGHGYPSEASRQPGWIKLTQTASKDPTMWTAWTGGNALNASSSMMYMFISIISNFLASLPLIIISVYGLIYMFASTLQMAFAPLFFLFAIHPTKGRRLFLGWLESIISNILKYLAASLMIVIGLTLYSSVLGTLNGVARLISSMVISLTLIFYRKEFTELMGQTSMGGTKIKNVIGDKMSGVAKKTGDIALGAGAGATGALLSGQNVLKGAGMGANIEAKRGRGFTAKTLQTRSRLQSEATRKSAERERQQQANDRLTAAMTNSNENIEKATNTMSTVNKKRDSSSKNNEKEAPKEEDTQESNEEK